MIDLFRYEEAVQWWLLAGLCGLCLVQPPLHASQDVPSPAPAGEGDFGTYLSSLQEKAHNGDKAAARELAVHYDVEGNAPETSKWMSEYVSLAEKEANGGDVDSMLDLGKLFYTGSRLYPKNLEKARYWFARAADSGNAAAQYQVAVMASKGTGGPKNEEMAARYYEKPSKHGGKRLTPAIPRRRCGWPLFMNGSWFRTALRKSRFRISFMLRKAAT